MVLVVLVLKGGKSARLPLSASIRRALALSGRIRIVQLPIGRFDFRRRRRNFCPELWPVGPLIDVFGIGSSDVLVINVSTRMYKMTVSVAIPCGPIRDHFEQPLSGVVRDEEIEGVAFAPLAFGGC
jgi:hypothetical protein